MAKYIDTFSPENWKKTLNLEQKVTYTVKLQGSVYQPTHSLAKNVRILVENNSSTNVPMATTTRQIISEVKPLYQEAYGHSFAESLTGVQIKTTDAWRKQIKRKIQRDCTDHINEQFKEKY